MSAAMATDQTMRQYCVDETSCGALCQHPQCWASMRRCEKGRPRLKDPVQTSWDATEDEGALPTLKVQNLLADSGLGSRGEYPTQRSGEGASTRSLHHRSSSAPAVDFENGQKHKFPYTPYTSPLGVRSTSARSVPSSLTERRPGKAKSVEVRELFELDELQSDLQQAFVPSHVYIWCPSKKAYERQLQRERGPTPPIGEQSEQSKPVTVKDMTDLMVPKAPKDKTRRAKKMKKKPSRITPTGGRPYTHPSRSSPVHRRTLPAEMDESISQLLSLPRDILMDVLVHIKNSDSLDKQKVQILLSRLMPLIHFDQNQPTHRTISPTPLLASGILQNKKMSLLQGRPHQADRDPETLAAAAAGATGAAHARNPFFLDDSLISAMTTSTYTALAQQLPVEESVAVNQDVMQTGRMARQQPLGPIQAGPAHDTAPIPQSQHIKNKLTSVSTKSLPPLAPGSRPTKPFDYKGAKSLDLTLGPLPTPDHLSPEKPSTPRSDKASTLFVTLPSVLSPDRTEMSTPLQPYGRVSADRGHSERLALQYLHDTPSPIASEDFHPLHAVSPSLSTGVPKAPLGTPATNINQPFHPTSASHQRPGRSPSPTKQTNQGTGGAQQREVNTASGPAANPSNPDALGTIREAHSEMTTSYPGTSAMDTSLPTSPVKQGVTPISTPWGNCTSITTGVISDRASRSPVPPVTPQPSTATPEPWPIVDERDFMTSPEKPRDIANGQMVNMATPMAPPPSPEPQELKNEFEFAVNDMSKSGMTSLTPLVEEGEEEEEEEEELAGDYRKEDNLEGIDGAEEQAIDTKRQESTSKSETEEIQPDIIGNQIHESTYGEPSKPETENPVDDAPPEEDQAVTVLNQDTAEERQDGTAADTLPSTEIHSSEPVGADDEMLDSHIDDQLNPDLTQESTGEAVVDRESASALEFPEPNVAMDETPSNEESYNPSNSALSKEDKMDNLNDGETLADQESRDHPIIPTENEITGETLDTASAPTNETQAFRPPDKDDKGEQNHAGNNDQVCLSAKNGDEPGSDLEEDQHGTSHGEEEPGDAKTKEDSVDDVQEQVADLDIDDGAGAEDSH